MHRCERSHLDEWATLLGTEVADDLLDDGRETLVCEDAREPSMSGDEAR